MSSLAHIMQKGQTGVIHGRFQVLHNDHLTYLLAGKAECDHLVVGITNPDSSLTREENVDPARSQPAANPLTYYERMLLIKCALYDSGLREADFSITPLPINFPQSYSSYVPIDATFFLTIYDQWGRRKLEYFKSMRLRTKILWECNPEDKGLSAGEIRKAMAGNEAWDHLVPESTAVLCRLWDIPGRLSHG